MFGTKAYHHRQLRRRAEVELSMHPRSLAYTGNKHSSKAGTTGRQARKEGSEWPNRVLTEGSRMVAAAQGEFVAATAWCSAGSPLVVVVRHSVKGM
jgi:hypothetical protein